MPNQTRKRSVKTSIGLLLALLLSTGQTAFPVLMAQPKVASAQSVATPASPTPSPTVGPTIESTQTVTLTATATPTATATVTATPGVSLTVTATATTTTTGTVTATAEMTGTVTVLTIGELLAQERSNTAQADLSTTALLPLTDTVILLTVAQLRTLQGPTATVTTTLTPTVTPTLTATATVTATTDAPAIAATSRPLLQIQTDGRNLNVRSGPGTSFGIVGRLAPDATVELLESDESNGWLRIRTQAEDDGSGDDVLEGWIASQYATPLAAPAQTQTSTPTPTLLTTSTLTVTATVTATSTATQTATPSATTAALNASTATPNAETTRIETEALTPEATVTPSDTPSNTPTVSITESLRVSVSVPAGSALTTPTPEPTPTVPLAITQPDNMNIRGGPGTDYEIVSVSTNGAQYEILASNGAGDWYQVQVDGLEEPGWVYAPLMATDGPMESVQPLADEEIPTLPEPEPAAEPAPVAAAAPVVNAPPPAGGGFFGYGVQAHMLGGGIGEAINATGDMGFNWIKQQVEWRVFEGSPGATDFSELRRIVDAAGGRGINVMFSVVNAPDWAREAGFDSSVGGPPADPQTMANFVGRLAGEFCGSQLKAIEVWNEQNLHYEWGNKPLDPAEYMNLLRASYASIKSACPSMLVISGALTPAGDAGSVAVDDFRYLEGMYQNGLAQVADGIGAHPSGYNVPPSVTYEQACEVIQQTGNYFNGPCDTPHHSWSFRSTMEGYRNIMVVYGDTNKRIWVTEFGWAAGGAFHPAYAYAEDNDFQEQANWTVEAYQMMNGWGWVGPAFLWNLNFRVVADGTEKAQWGIVRNDYTPLPIYEALRAMPK